MKLLNTTNAALKVTYKVNMSIKMIFTCMAEYAKQVVGNKDLSNKAKQEGRVSEMVYKVFFEIYGKKMQAKIIASSPNDAIKSLRDKIIIHEVRRDGHPSGDEDVNRMDNPDLEAIFPFLFGQGFSKKNTEEEWEI